MERYLKSTEIIDCDTESIKEKAQELTEGLKTDRDKAVALFYFVRDKIKYDPFSPGYLFEDHKASTVLERHAGFCQHKAVLLVALARAAGIPARLGFADIRDHLSPRKLRELMGGDNLFTYHGYAELYIDGRWVIACPTFDLKTCLRNRFVPVDFDGVNDAKDSPCNQDGECHIKYIHDRGHFDDFPWDELYSARLEYAARVGKDLSELAAKWWRRKPTR